MCNRKTATVGFLALYASLCFVAVEVEGFRLRAAKMEVKTFLNFLLNDLGFADENDLADIFEAEDLDQLTETANNYITDNILNIVNHMPQTNPRRHQFLSEVYTQYQHAFARLLDEDWETVNHEIPLAQDLAWSLCIHRTEFELEDAKELIITLLQFLQSLIENEEEYEEINQAQNFDELVGAANGFLTEEEEEELCEAATGENNHLVPAAMQMQFNNYQNAMQRLVNEDPITRGRDMPLIGTIFKISGYFPPPEE